MNGEVVFDGEVIATFSTDPFEFEMKHEYDTVKRVFKRGPPETLLIGGDPPKRAEGDTINVDEEITPDAEKVFEHMRNKLQARGFRVRGTSKTANKSLGEGVTDQELAHAPEWDRPLLEMHRGITNPDSDPNRALVDFSASGTPEFVLERIREAIMGGALFSDFEDIPSSELMDFRQTFADAVGTDNFTLDSVTDAVMDFGDIDRQRAERIARTETSAVLNSAREDGYQERGEDDALFYWTGAEPGDDRQTEACRLLIERTNPFHGGEPVPLEELRSLLTWAAEEGEDTDPSMVREGNWLIHIGERSTFSKAPPNWQQL